MLMPMDADIDEGLDIFGDAGEYFFFAPLMAPL